MIKSVRYTPWLALVLLFCAVAQANPLQGEHRTPEFAERDVWRHPGETLSFFSVEPDMTLVEIWPGGGWYTEILAPLMRDGVFYAAHFSVGIGVKYYDLSRQHFEEKLRSSPAVYGNVKLSTFDPARGQLLTPEAAADRVLTFRNVHNWLRTDSEQQAFNLFFKALKPGGILGVVEHRAKEGTTREAMLASGYMTESYVIELAENAGFVLEAQSDINANPKDSADHPAGVWTLPPTLRLGSENREKYLAIGESDRMTLKFRKPSAP